MAVLTSQRTRRRNDAVRRLARTIFGSVLVFGIILGAALLSRKPAAGSGGEPQDGLDGGGGARAVSLDAVQDKVAELDWVRQELLPVNDYSRPGTALKKVNAIVIHYVGNPGTTAAQNRSYYTRLADSGETSASSNFLIGMEGEILACVPVNEVAYCSNWRNEDTLSIEYCHPDETGQFTDNTYDALVRLTAWLCSELNLDASDIIRHYDVTGKECPKYFVDHENAWDDFKDDVTSALKDLQALQETKTNP
jgi:N-acetyl-anhydromuramyl-L-alanine amidase AmpD